ncbi:MAG: aspartate kinase [Cyclobacteriaceae bacterium]
MLVQKFGGTSVGTPQRMHHIARLIEEAAKPTIVVLSAVSGTTNALERIIESFKKGDHKAAKQKADNLKTTYFPFVYQLFENKSDQEKGAEIIERHFMEIHRLISQPYYPQIEKVIVVQGELISTHLFQLYMQSSGRNSILIPAADFMYLDENGEPNLPVIRKKLESIIYPYPADIFLTQGFICRNLSGGIDNLKRGGSDYSATLIGAALRAKETQIWTDIDGMHNNDPRIVDRTKPISDLSFEEAGELAYFGAKILHPNCIIPAQQQNVPVRIKNTMDPSAYGTLITSNQSPQAVKAIAAKDGITAIKIKSSRMTMAYGFLRKVFEVFEYYKTPIDMITTSEIAVSLTIDKNEYLNDIVKDISQYGKVEVDQHQTIICIVGDLVAEKKGVGREIFKALENVPMRMIAYGGSRNNISILVESSLKKEALVALNNQLFQFN